MLFHPLQFGEQNLTNKNREKYLEKLITFNTTLLSTVKQHLREKNEGTI